MCSSHIVNEGISIDMGIDPGLWGSWCCICNKTYKNIVFEDFVGFFITNNANKQYGRPFMLFYIQHASPKNKYWEEAQHLLLLFLQWNSMLYLSSPTSTLSATYALLPQSRWFTRSPAHIIVLWVSLLSTQKCSIIDVEKSIFSHAYMYISITLDMTGNL